VTLILKMRASEGNYYFFYCTGTSGRLRLDSDYLQPCAIRGAKGKVALALPILAPPVKVKFSFISLVKFLVHNILVSSDYQRAWLAEAAAVEFRPPG
jgi:hypothetical protein